jgi:protein phosphatase methylesterase 1
MTCILSKRPTKFDAPKDAITWVLEHSLSRSMRAASISVPSQLVKDAGGSWGWRTPLLKSEPYWQGWYLGLSEAFLSVPVPKVLMLAGADRLDRPLTIAQMQGKFQAVLVPNSGHAVHEDEAEEVTASVRNFIQRFRIGLPPLEIPRATPGLAPILPQAIGPLFQNN